MDELVHYLDTLIRHPEKRFAMGQNARNHILANLSWDRVMARYNALWEELSKIAETLPQQLPPYRNLPQPQYFKNFGHFVSQRLSGIECLALTERGRQAYRNPDSIFLHPEMRQVLSFKVLMVILKFIRMANSFKIKITLQEVCEKIGSRHHLTSQATLVHVMWLLKYGLIRVA